MNWKFLKTALFTGAIAIILLHCGPEKGEETTMSTIIKNAQSIDAPIAKEKDTTLTQFDDKRPDPFYWMNQRENPEVKAHLEAENEYLEKVMKDVKGLRENLFEEIVNRIPGNDQSAPYLQRGYYYYSRYEEGKEHPIYARRKGSMDAAEEVLLNVNELAEGFDYYQVGGLSVSPDNQWLAFGVDTLSRRIYTIHLKNLKSGEILDFKIPNTTGRAVWAADNQTLFYSQKDETLRPYKILRQSLNSDADPVTIYTEEDPTYVCFVDKTQSGDYLAIGSVSTLTTEYRILPADQPQGEWQVFAERERGIEYDIDHLNDRFYILTNWEAENFRLMATSPDKTAKKEWLEIIPARKDVLLQDFTPFRDFLALNERVDGISKIRILDKEGDSHFVDFGEDAYTAQIGTNKEAATDLLRIRYTSMTTPMSHFDYNFQSKDLSLVKEQKVVGDFNKENYTTERRMATARDGTKIPLSIVYRNGFKKDGSQPLLLYGYGSYGYSMEPYFSHVRLSLLDRGFAFVIAHIRGGEEMGRHWYEEGKLLKKKNTFTDFIDCGQFLVEENYTSKQHLYAMGGSAGGLLIGSVINMAPDLFRGVIAAVPFVDVVTTMLDESIPLTTGEYDEWGNPNQEEYYHYIKSYSPYDNVREQDYPAVLATTGFHDSQVQYWEPAKWIAKLRMHNTGDQPMLLHTNMKTGHGGASGRFERYKESALEYAFFLDLEGIRD